MFNTSKNNDIVLIVMFNTNNNDIDRNRKSKIIVVVVVVVVVVIVIGIIRIKLIIKKVKKSNSKGIIPPITPYSNDKLMVYMCTR